MAGPTTFGYQNLGFGGGTAGGIAELSVEYVVVAGGGGGGKSGSTWGRGGGGGGGGYRLHQTHLS